MAVPQISRFVPSSVVTAFPTDAVPVVTFVVIRQDDGDHIFQSGRMFYRREYDFAVGSDQGYQRSARSCSEGGTLNAFYRYEPATVGGAAVVAFPVRWPAGRMLVEAELQAPGADVEAIGCLEVAEPAEKVDAVFGLSGCFAEPWPTAHRLFDYGDGGVPALVEHGCS